MSTAVAAPPVPPLERAAVGLAESGVLPDALLRWGVRRRLAATLADLAAGGPEAAHERERALLAAMRAAPIALATHAANAQHYEVPSAFFDLVLGPWRKYSCCLWEDGTTTLPEAEDRMLALTASRAGVADGMRLLDLGCGWGSFSLWAAERFPNARITALSNSRGQRAFIEAKARERGLVNLEVVTADAARFDTDQRFDRVVSIEMFEHMRNVEALLARIARWLAPDGRLLVHVFSHRQHAYTFDDPALSSWMGAEFFTGGMMPSDALYLNFQRDLELCERWIVGGTHYARTLRAWLDRLDAHRAAATEVLAGAALGQQTAARQDATRQPDAREHAARQIQRWRLFFIACEEAFGYAGGSEWRVSHYLFRRRP